MCLFRSLTLWIFFERRDACKTKENDLNDVRAEGVTTNHCVMVNLLRIANLQSRSLFSTVGSFGSSSPLRFVSAWTEPRVSRLAERCFCPRVLLLHLPVCMNDSCCWRHRNYPKNPYRVEGAQCPTPKVKIQKAPSSQNTLYWGS